LKKGIDNNSDDTMASEIKRTRRDLPSIATNNRRNSRMHTFGKKKKARFLILRTENVIERCLSKKFENVKNNENRFKVFVKVGNSRIQEEFRKSFELANLFKK